MILYPEGFMRKAVINGNIILPGEILQDKTLLIYEDKIEAIVPSFYNVEGCQIIDAKGRYVSPGFIDMHVHGGGGYSFMDGDVESFLKVAETHAKHGTTAMLPTTMACSLEELRQTLSVYDAADAANHRGSQFLGFNLEGPYFSLEQCGAQNPEYITPPKPKEYKELADMCPHIVMWCSAPELEGSLEFAKFLTQRGIIPSIAHTNAHYDQVKAGVAAGYRHVTHLYSGMTGVFRINAFRHAGVVESAFLIDDLTVEIIADGCHLPEALLKLIYKGKGSDKIALVTDATNGAGTDAKETILGSRKNGMKVVVEDGVAKTMDRQSFAGSVATTDRLVRTMIQLAEVPVEEAVKMATLTPANILGVEKNKGSLEPGKDADILLFDENVNVSLTMLKGKVLFGEV